MTSNFNFNSPRSRDARLEKNFGNIIGAGGLILAIVLALAGVALLYIKVPLGWLILSLAAWPLALQKWRKNYLKILPAGKNPDALDQILDGELLGNLPARPSPKAIAQAAMKTSGGRFFYARFGISAQYLPELCSDDPADSDGVWQRALDIRANLAEKSDILNSATVCAALVQTSPAMLKILPTLGLDADDILAGANWHAHLLKLIRENSKPKLTGGVARDWSFGWIPTLQHFGVNLSQKYGGGRSLNVHLEDRDDLIEQMIRIFSSGGRQNVALVGRTGVGKRTLVDSLAERLMDPAAKIPRDLKFHQIISLDAAALIGAAPGRGQLENLLNQILVEAYRAKNIIICLENAQTFFEDGTGSVDLSNLLTPILEGGGLRLILTLDEQRFLQISAKNPALAAALNRLNVAPPNEIDTLKILQDQIISIEFSHKVTFMYQALKEAYRLSSRYNNSMAQPRAAIQLLENSAAKADRGLVTAQSVRDSVEATTGIKIAGDLTGSDSAAEREKLLNLENLIHQRMINQTAAVGAVSAALRRARAGVRSEKRPIGTFLFLGPTGVGKTELAKSLAAVYFGGEQNLLRIDLNEFVRADDVARLIVDGASDPNSLAAQVQKNPFSVVLLDEIEKAHPAVLTTLLQVLDEGILRDINGKEISFRDAIIVATSNAGADRIRQYIDAGYKIEQFSRQIQDELISTGQFKPEFLNRFDEVVMFRPLTKDELLQVVDLILKGVNETLAEQKVEVAVDDDAKKALVEAGYDPKLGARPLRRVVQKTVENIVAEKMLSGELAPGTGLKITLADIENSGGLKNE
jgi:ATP-dependent Clp protease ATP-binding subunit ClpC